MRRARLIKPYKGYRDILVDEESLTGGYLGYHYNCIIMESGAEISCYRDEFEFID